MKLLEFLKFYFNWYKEFFFRKKSVIDESFDHLFPEKCSTEIKIPQERIIQHYDSSKKTIVIIDDSRLVLSMVEEYLDEIGVSYEEFNVLKFYGIYAPFVLKETLKELKEIGLETIDYAIIDIVLPGKLKEGNKYVKMDGIDVSILLNSEYNCNDFLFFSGNVLNVYVDFIQEKIEKFHNYFGKDLRKFIVLKTKGDEHITNKFKRLLKF